MTDCIRGMAKCCGVHTTLASAPPPPPPPPTPPPPPLTSMVCSWAPLSLSLPSPCTSPSSACCLYPCTLHSSAYSEMSVLAAVIIQMARLPCRTKLPPWLEEGCTVLDVCWKTTSKSTAHQAGPAARDMTRRYESSPLHKWDSRQSSDC